MYGPLDKIGFGCVALSTLPNSGAAQKLLEVVLDAGITHFDTAPVYGKGYSERILGEFLRRKRDRVTVTTKFGLGVPGAFAAPIWLALPLNYFRRCWRSRVTVRRRSSSSAERSESDKGVMLTQRRITRSEIERSFESSCRALQTDYLDYYLLHEGLPWFLDHDALDYLIKLKNKGSVRQIGLAAGGRNYHALSRENVAVWDVLQYEFGPAWPNNAALLRQFPNKMHIFHSCLKGLSSVGSDDRAGRMLEKCCAANPRGKVLFSSSNLEHIRRNVQVLSALLSVRPKTG
jgi:aryl-alcohol dehydrogenase-like predicted oxidoreductase